MSRRNLTARLAEIESLLASGTSPGAAVREACARFGIGTRQAQKYVSRVFAGWAAEQVEFRRHRKAQMRAVLGELYRQCLDAGKLTVAVRVLDLLCKMDGLYEPEKHEVAMNSDWDIRSMTSHEKRQRLDGLLKKRARAMSDDRLQAEIDSLRELQQERIQSGNGPQGAKLPVHTARSAGDAA